MTSWKIFLAVIFLGLLTSLGLLAPSGAGQDGGASQNETCSCDELNNILNRLVTVENAIRLFTQAYVNQPENQPFSGQTFGRISQDIGQQLSTEFDPYPRNYKGVDAGITSGLCIISIPDDVSPCIAQSLRLHEQVHQQLCLAGYGVTNGTDWHVHQTMREALFEEISGYQAERAFLTKQRQKRSVPALITLSGSVL